MTIDNKASLASSSTKGSKTTVGNLLFERLAKVTKSVFGVPGDFNLKLLEHIYDVPGIEWVGNNNELNAAYVADGYTRINPNNFSCLITTYGVGELSALNGIAGSFTEDVAVLHIVGTSASRVEDMYESLNEQDAMFRNIHHLIPGSKSYSKQDHQVYEKIVGPFCCVSERLTNDDIANGTIQTKIDNAIMTTIKQNKPGYLFIPSDISDAIVDCDLSVSLEPKQLPLSSVEEEIVSLLLSKIYAAKNVGVIPDYFLKNERDSVEKLLQKTNWSTYSTPTSRGLCFDESIGSFKGVFCNETSPPGVLESIKTHDLILHLGSKINETTFRCINPDNSKWLDDANIVFLGREYAMIGYRKPIVKDIDGVKIFRELMKQLDYSKLASPASNNKQEIKFSDSYDLTEMNKSEDLLFESQLSYELSANYLKENDIVICEMSSFTFEMEYIKLPKNARSFAQTFYASIGYALPACVGACKALKDYNLESKHRVVLIQGDGSAQMTLQEMSLFLAYDLKPVIFMLNNSGYTIERAILGEQRSYNDLTTKWNWTKMLQAFGDENKQKHDALTVENYSELKQYMAKKTDPKKLHMVELVLQKTDYSNGLKKFLGKK